MARMQLTLEITEALDQELSRLAALKGLTKADVIRRGLALAKVAIDERARGNALGILDERGGLICELTGI